MQLCTRYAPVADTQQVFEDDNERTTSNHLSAGAKAAAKTN
jgi:hypothetical protein